MPRKILFGDDLHKKCREIMNLLHKAVSSSLGPSGKLSLLDRQGQNSLITKDGVTICRHMLPTPDETMNIIGGKILEIANQTNYEAGDGTTTSIVLANALYTEALKYIKDIDPVIIAKEIDEELPNILKLLDKMSTKIEDIKEMESVATISANNDADIGKIIAKAIDSVGQDGFVTLTEGDGSEATLSITE